MPNDHGSNPRYRTLLVLVYSASHAPDESLLGRMLVAGAPTRDFAPSVICADMHRVFVSHASADAELVDKFVDTLLRNGCNLGPDDLFYSSGEDTGVPSGEDLIATVRREVSDATLVIAVITPTYQTRPICIAELGAAWGRAGHLMSLIVPGLPRSDLEGVLDGMTIRTLDDSSALDELHDRVVAVTGVDVRAATWNRHKQRWQRDLPEMLPGVPTPATIALAEFEQLRRDLDGARAALDEVEAENAELQRQRDALKELKDAELAAEVLLPEGERQRFEQLVDNAKQELKDFDDIVLDAIWADRFGPGLVRPWQDDYRAEQADKNVNAGLLWIDDDAVLHPDDAAGSIRRTQAAVERLETFLAEASAEFDAWFETDYDFRPSLSRKAVWDQLIT
jgi:hypothetical protein